MAIKPQPQQGGPEVDKTLFQAHKRSIKCNADSKPAKVPEQLVGAENKSPLKLRKWD